MPQKSSCAPTAALSCINCLGQCGAEVMAKSSCHDDCGPNIKFGHLTLLFWPLVTLWKHEAHPLGAFLAPLAKLHSDWSTQNLPPGRIVAVCR